MALADLKDAYAHDGRPKIWRSAKKKRDPSVHATGGPGGEVADAILAPSASRLAVLCLFHEFLGLTFSQRSTEAGIRLIQQHRYATTRGGGTGSPREPLYFYPVSYPLPCPDGLLRLSGAVSSEQRGR